MQPPWILIGVYPDGSEHLLAQKLTMDFDALAGTQGKATHAAEFQQEHAKDKKMVTVNFRNNQPKGKELTRLCCAYHANVQVVHMNVEYWCDEKTAIAWAT